MIRPIFAVFALFLSGPVHADPTEIDIARKVLAQARENASRCGGIDRASNQ